MVNDAKIKFRILMTVGVNSGKLNSRIYEGCLNYGLMWKLKWNLCMVYQSSINWYLGTSNMPINRIPGVINGAVVWYRSSGSRDYGKSTPS